MRTSMKGSWMEGERRKGTGMEAGRDNGRELGWRTEPGGQRWQRGWGGRPEGSLRGATDPGNAPGPPALNLGPPES